MIKNNVSEFETTNKGYNLLSLGAGSSFIIDKFLLKAGINVTNLTNENYIAHLSRLKPDGIANMGRSINVNLKLEL